MKTYTEDEIKAAFWKAFHESGELWFGYLGKTPKEKADDEADTESYWLGLLKALRGEE